MPTTTVRLAQPRLEPTRYDLKTLSGEKVTAEYEYNSTEHSVEVTTDKTGQLELDVYYQTDSRRYRILSGETLNQGGISYYLASFTPGEGGDRVVRNLENIISGLELRVGHLEEQAENPDEGDDPGVGN